MGALKRLWASFRAVPRRTFVFSLAALAVLLIVTGGVVYGWDYTNSPPFCGTTCHTMPPEYAAYQVSPHARVACVECHIGRGFVGNLFTRKAGDLMHVVRYSSNQYTFPLYATTMEPARESCEKCHWPAKFSNDKVITLKHYEDNAANTADTTLLVMKTGGGTAREGQGFGIHWHIENNVQFIATDALKQNIPWIQVTDANGKVTVYRDVEQPLTDDEIAKATKNTMDCIDCHNRVSHSFKSPDQEVDQALTLNRIDATIPSIHQKAVEVLSAKYSSFDEAAKAIEGLDQYYRQTYPDYYKGGSGNIQSAITFLKQTYSQLIFPDQSLSWTTHPDNLGHKDAPGCFRCHDGKHFTADDKNAIRLECNVCHTLPEVARGSAPAPVVSVTQGDEPASHRTTTWLAQHRTVFDASCQQCHDTRNAGGSDNSSFCSNSACHGTKWTYAGLNAPALAKIFPPPVQPQPKPGAAPPKIPHPIGGSPDCQICHGPTSLARPFPSDHVGRTNDQCLACHQPTLAPAAPATLAGGPPTIPHELTGRNECLGCHDSGASGVPQIPQFHKDYGFANSACLTCHKSALQTTAPATPTPAGVGQLPTPTEITASATASATSTVVSSATTETATTTPAASATTGPTAAATPAASPSVAATTAPTSAAATGGPPALPSDHGGRTVCTACHASGVGGAPKLPTDHAGRDDTTCLACHKPK